jgi:3-oxoacyl-[acyl-carrier-protein] synthase III
VNISIPIKIVTTGRHLPPRVQTAAELAPLLRVTEDWIVSKTGVERRHISDVGMAQMGAWAAQNALGKGRPPDLILNASAVPQQVVPDSSVYIQQAMGLSGIQSFSIHATCLSFPVALYTAGNLIQSGGYGKVLVVSSECGSRGRNFEEPESASLFGDGAAAVVVEPTPVGEKSAILGFQMGTWPEGASHTEVRGGGTKHHPNDPDTVFTDNLFHMDGPKVYRMALRRSVIVLNRLFKSVGIDREEVKLVVPHQASAPAVAAIERFGFAPEKVVRRIHEEGNCVAASIPLALAHANQQGLLHRGDLVLLCGTGAGLSVLAMLLRW